MEGAILGDVGLPLADETGLSETTVLVIELQLFFYLKMYLIIFIKLLSLQYVEEIVVDYLDQSGVVCRLNRVVELKICEKLLETGNLVFFIITKIRVRCVDFGKNSFCFINLIF